MNKVATVLMGMMVFLLVGCGSSDSGATGAKTPEEFMTSAVEYSEKQQALMYKQAEGQSGAFEQVSEHSKAVLESEEYAGWETAAKELSAIKIADGEGADQVRALQTALDEYYEIQKEYFQKVAEAADVDSYNQVNEDLVDKLSDAQDNFADIWSNLEF